MTFNHRHEDSFEKKTVDKNWIKASIKMKKQNIFKSFLSVKLITLQS